MIRSAAILLAKRGLQGASFSEVLEDSKAPRGSVYHHFPEGKDQLVHAALEAAKARLMTLLDAQNGKPITDLVKWFFGAWREVLTRSNFSAGCAVVAVTVDATDPKMRTHAADIFRGWRDAITVQLLRAGLTTIQATQFGVTLIAAAEGAVVICRAEQTMEPLDSVEQMMLQQARALTRKK